MHGRHLALVMVLTIAAAVVTWGCGGKKSVARANCGNGVLDTGETCDDNNTISGDGCSSSCQVEDGWNCSTSATSGVSICTKCGNGVIDDGETCDDNNTVSGDGCSSSCQIEFGWMCSTSGVSTCTPVCGDGVVVGNEGCDDGNNVSGDGCYHCQVEIGWSCSISATSGLTTCTYLCGNGVVDDGEACDDNNTASGDGCSGSCRVEKGWTCQTSAPSGVSVCTTTCGDGIVAGNEGCEDGNDVSGDGCYHCQIENGWNCSISATTGLSTCTLLCGNSVVDDSEACDDGNTISGDGCSSSCQVENGWTCSTSGNSTISTCTTICGDGIVAGNESCEDGNDVPYDGCYQCQIEPSCASGECPQTCGDGIITGNEVCDDGNTVDGDGCSADCLTMGTTQAGWNCTNVSSDMPDTLVIPVVFRDFKSGYSDATNPHCAAPDPSTKVVLSGEDASGHPDFECYAGNAQTVGLVGDTLAINATVDTLYGDENRYLPVFASNGVGSTYGRQLTDNSGALDTTSDAAHYFNQWYRNVTGINQVVVSTLTLTWDNANNVYTFDSGAGFFPLDGLGWGNTPVANEANDSVHNFSFTSEVRYWFKFEGERMTLSFSGDDDVWIFINHKLAIDLGGLHPRSAAELVINPDGTAVATYDQGTPTTKNLNLGLTTNHVYEMSLFHAERHTSQSNFKLSLGNFVKTTTSCASICGDGIVVGTEQCDKGPLNGRSNCSKYCTLVPQL